MAANFSKDANISEEHVKKVLEQIDTDNDGKISKEEFTKTSRLKLLEAYKDSQ